MRELNSNSFFSTLYYPKTVNFLRSLEWTSDIPLLLSNNDLKSERSKSEFQSTILSRSKGVAGSSSAQVPIVLLPH